MAKIFLLIMGAVLLFTTTTFGQYNIKSKTEGYVLNNLNTVNIIDSVHIDVINTAKMRYIKQQIWNERNFLETKNSLYITQFSYSNWAEGGHNSFNAKVASQTKHIYKNGGTNINSYLNISYALGNEGEIMQKTDDAFELNSDISNLIWGRWYYSFGFNLKSQFTNTYNYTKIDGSESADETMAYDKTLLSGFFAPGTINPYAGITYKLGDKRTVMASPISGNMVMVLNDELSQQGVFGVEKGKKTDTNIGLYVNINWEEKLVKDGSLTYRTNIQSFYGYDFTGIPDFSWESWLDYNLFKYFNVSLYAKFIYNSRIENLPNPNSFWQVKQSLGFGITYNFKNKIEP